MADDLTIKCSVCKTPFLWTVAEQRAAAEQRGPDDPEAKPDRCPMCRRIAPGQGRLRGIVKWYSRGKGYGFITTVQGTDIFLHKSVLQEGQAPYAGQLVEFTLAQGPRGVQAEDLDILTVAEGSATTPG